MDALSKILDDIHMRGAEYLYISGCDDWHFCLDTHGEFVFHIVLWGHCVLSMEEQAAQVIQGGDIIMLPTGKKHYIHGNTANSALSNPYNLRPEFRGHRNDSLHLGGHRQASSLVLSIRCLLDVDMARPLLGALPPVMTIRNAMGTGAPPWLQIGLQFLALETERSRPGRDTLINRLVGMLMIECIRDYIEQLPEGSDNWLTALRDPQLAPVLSAIHACPEQAWTVAELASLACMSRSTFAERFSHTIGESPLAYLAAHRLRLAAWHLRENNRSIGRIAEKVGYASETAFSQAFKRIYGVSPGQYRKQWQNQTGQDI
ncbi:cupin domain-containing protein [Alkanindiges sp. WGS2144]|uniref:AraC family transcriptional regulator n=1 Tax=Alkanindiges sp. WGS2144 TaxID=3366808 RepID=UPI003751EDBC